MWPLVRASSSMSIIGVGRSSRITLLIDSFFFSFCVHFSLASLASPILPGVLQYVPTVVVMNKTKQLTCRGQGKKSGENL